MSTEKLSNDNVQQLLEHLTEWKLSDGAISRTYAFPGFVKSMQFVNSVAETAEKIQHHPDIDIRFNKVTLALTTHDAGGLTQLDFDLASVADEVADAVGGA